jgi:hypothetical protein
MAHTTTTQATPTKLDQVERFLIGTITALILAWRTAGYLWQAAQALAATYVTAWQQVSAELTQLLPEPALAATPAAPKTTTTKTPQAAPQPRPGARQRPATKTTKTKTTARPTLTAVDSAADVLAPAA